VSGERALRRSSITGYSGTPLAKKLGAEPQPKLVVIGAPWNYVSTLGLKGDHRIGSRMGKQEHYVHLFASSTADLKRLPAIASAIADDGMLWISWPRRTQA